jgi:dTDP-4-amino-4,6-dideoxygalactose transaminase
MPRSYQEHPDVNASSQSQAQPSTVHVPLLDLTQQYAALRDELLAAVTEVLDSQKCINGPQVAQFEQQAAAYCQCEHAVAVSSGTDALLCSLMALGIGPGDEVITTPFTFFATAGSIWRAGARPVFVDIEPTTFNIDPAQIENAITERTRAIMPVHLFGQLADMTRINAVAEQYNLAVIEDAAQAIGAKQNGQAAGTLGTIGCFSFFPSKNLGGLGDGGMIVTGDKSLAERCASLRTHGESSRYHHDRVGGNFRMDTIQAAYLSVKLKHLPAWHEARQANARYYDQALAGSDGIALPHVAPENVSIYNQYVIRAERRDALKQHLADHDIASAIYYPRGLHEQACFAELGYGRGAFPHAERAAEQVLALPVFPELTGQQIEHVCDTIKAFYRQT